MEKVCMSQSKVHEFGETAKSHGCRVLYYIYANAMSHEYMAERDNILNLVVV